MNAITEEEVIIEPQEQPTEEVVELPQPIPPTPIRLLATTKAELEGAYQRFKAFVERFESDQKRLEGATKEENEILDSGGNASEEEQLERLTRTLALKKVLERRLESQESGRDAVADQLGAAAREALRSLWQELGDLRAKREEKHLAALKKLVSNEDQWPWAEKHARMLVRYFGDLFPLEQLGGSADYSLSHGAILAGAEQTLADIATFEASVAAKR